MFNIGGRAHRFLNRVHDALFNIERRCPLIDDTDKSNRDLDLGEEIHRQALEGREAQHDHREREHEDPDAIAQCEKGQPHIRR